MNVYKGRLLKKSSNRKSKLVLSTLVTAWLWNIAFHLQPIWLQTLVAINSELRLTSFPSFCVQPSEVPALFNLNLSRRPFLRQVVNTDLLQRCFAQDLMVLWFCSYLIFLLRDEWMIERFSEAMGAAVVGNNISQILWKFHFTWKKMWLVAAWNLQSIKTLLALDSSQYRKSGSMFSSTEPVAASSDCCWLSGFAQASQRAAPKAWLLILNSKPSIIFWNSLRLLRDCQMTGRGSNLDSNLNCASWPTGCKGFIASEITAQIVWSFNSF